MVVGDEVVIYVYLDEITNRLAGTTKIEHYVKHESSAFREKEMVKVLIYRKTPAGYQAIIENKCLGMIYQNEIFKPIHIGERITAFIKKLREDGKVDLTLQEEGYGKIGDFSDTLYEFLVENGETDLNDKSSPEAIKEKFGVSKKSFQKGSWQVV